MIALLQRVSRAEVRVGADRVASIGQGLLVLVAVERGDSLDQSQRLAQRICGYRVFSDKAGKMNLSVVEQRGAVLLVPQFTLAADTAKGMRPSFTAAASSTVGEPLFNELAAAVEANIGSVQKGIFGAHMVVSLVNDGPVTFWLRA